MIAAPDSTTLPTAIRTMRDRYAARGVTAYAIGNGLCDDFARDVLELWIGEDWMGRDGEGFDFVETGNFVVREGNDAMDWDWPLLAAHWNMAPPDDVDPDVLTNVAQHEPGHVWIAVDGRHYDAESPDGVASFLDLNFFRRWLDRDVNASA